MTTTTKEPRSGGHVLLWIVGLLGLFAGGAAVAWGLYLFYGAATTPSATFFADPHGTMDRTRNDAFLGVGLFGIGSLVASVGAVLTLVAGILELQRRPVRFRERSTIALGHAEQV
jgi:hypothetical protein